MDPVFSLGISSLWDELRHMPTGGVWWVNADRQQDAISLVNQTIASQTENANVAVISMEGDPGKVIKLDESHGPEKIRLFTMPDSEKGLYSLPRDLLCSVNPTHYFFILICANNTWRNITSESLHKWLEKMNTWTRFHHCSLLVINPCHNSDKQSSLLMGEYRSLFGLASLRFQGDQHLFDIAFWCNEKALVPDSSYCYVSRTNTGRYPIRKRRQFSRVATKNAFLATSPSLKARRRSRNTGRFSTITKRYSTTRARRRPRRLFFSHTE